MTQELALWIIGILLAVVGFLVVRVLRQGDDTNEKVSALGLAVARLEGLHARVDSLDEWRARTQQRALEMAEARAVEAERRHGPPDRRDDND